MAVTKAELRMGKMYFCHGEERTVSDVRSDTREWIVARLVAPPVRLAHLAARARIAPLANRLGGRDEKFLVRGKFYFVTARPAALGVAAGASALGAIQLIASGPRQRDFSP